MLLKQKGGTVGDSPQTRLAKAMYVLHINNMGERVCLCFDRHGPCWVPAWCVRPALTKLQVPGKQQTTAKDPEGPAETSEDILSDHVNCFDGK